MKKLPQSKTTLIMSLFLILLVASACTLGQNPEPIIQVETILHTVEVTHEVEVTRLIEILVTSTLTPTPELSPTQTLTPTITSTPTITPTYGPLRANVVEQANCRYGPGAAYLYKFGLYAGNRIEIVGRNDPGTWVYIQAIGGSNRCWVNAGSLDINGDLDTVPTYYSRLPFSELYSPPQGVSAVRQGNEVVISWPAVYMTEDDYRGYLIEAWLCQEGQIVFTPISVDGTIYTVLDEPGCMQPSSARLYTAEKHGYTRWIPIPWPAHETNP
jgi:hypothetical protein